MKIIYGCIVLVVCGFLGVTFFAQEKSGSEKFVGVGQAFSFKEIEAIESFDLVKPSFLQASDGVQLALYQYASPEDKNVVILYAGAGLYGNQTYQYVAKRLHEEYGIGCYIFDIRGHGHSQGERGDAPSIQQVWDDVTQAVQFVKAQHPQAKIYLTGHSSGAGLIINYAAHTANTLEDGYIFLAPYLGPKSETLKDHARADESFVTAIRPWVYILGMLFPSSSMIHWNAVFFNYPQYVLQADPFIVPVYTYVMSSATTPYDIETLLPQVKKPTAVFIGNHDEQFDPEKVIARTKLIQAPVASYLVHDAGHLSILLQTPQLIADYIFDDLNNYEGSK